MRQSLFALLVVCLLPLGCGLKLTPELGGNTVNQSGLLPLGVGKTWTYSVAQLNSSPLCGSGSASQTITATSSLGGQTAYQMSALCPGQSAQQLAFDGQRVLIYYGNLWEPALDTPLTDGHGWSSDRSYVWSNAGTQTVTAGTFQNCWERRDTNTGYNSFQIYCPAVGKIVDHFDTGGTGYTAQLTGKNF